MRKENLAKIKKIIQERINTNKAFSELTHFLTTKGIAKPIVETVVNELRGSDEIKEWLALLNELLAAKIKTESGFIFSKNPSKIALVGPTGVGKTTTVLKLADFYGKDKKVAILSLDHEKGGAYGQLEKYWNGPLYKNYNEVEAGYELLLIDTSGCNTYEESVVERMAGHLSSIPKVEVHLTLSAAAKEVDLYGAMHQFSSLNPRSLIITKLDETLASGVIVNLSAKVDVPISFVAYGYPLPGKIEKAVGSEIAHKILTDFNKEDYHFLRRLVSAHK